MSSVCGERQWHKESEGKKIFSCMRQICVEGFRVMSLWPDSSDGCLALWAGHLLEQRDLSQIYPGEGVDRDGEFS